MGLVGRIGVHNHRLNPDGCLNLIKSTRDWLPRKIHVAGQLPILPIKPTTSSFGDQFAKFQVMKSKACLYSMLRRIYIHVYKEIFDINFLIEQMQNIEIILTMMQKR